MKERPFDYRSGKVITPGRLRGRIKRGKHGPPLKHAALTYHKAVVFIPRGVKR